MTLCNSLQLWYYLNRNNYVLKAEGRFNALDIIGGGLQGTTIALKLKMKD